MWRYLARYRHIGRATWVTAEWVTAEWVTAKWVTATSSDDEAPPPIDRVPAILHKTGIRVTRLVDCSSSDEEPPPPINEDTHTSTSSATSGIDVKALEASVKNMSLDEPADPPSEQGDATAVSSVDVVEDDFTAGCQPKPYRGRAPTAEERRTWESAATRYYQNLLSKYQQAIERLRVTAHEFLQQDGLDVSKFVERHNRMAKKTGLKGGLEATRAYFALATLYGDVGGSYEPERLDWYRAQYATELPNPLPAKCMFVHVTETAVTMILRDGNKRWAVTMADSSARIESAPAPASPTEEELVAAIRWRDARRAASRAS